MNISINCKISLSKKLRSMLGKEGSLTLVVKDIVDGRGNGILSLESDQINQNFDTNETAIMLTPVELSQETPTSDSIPYASIFSNISDGDNGPVVNKLAAVRPPEKGKEAKAIKQNVEIPEAFKELSNHQCQNWISNMEGLIKATIAAKNKKSEINPSSAQNKREQALLTEMKEKEEAIDTACWIVNTKYGMLTINDLNLSLPLNSPFDLSNISAKRISVSKELKDLILNGSIKIISPKEKDSIIENAFEDNNVRSDGLEVFSNHAEAEASIKNSSSREDEDDEEKPRRPRSIRESRKEVDEDNTVEWTEADLNKPTEEESMVLNLTQNMPSKKHYNEPSTTSEPRTTRHSNNQSNENRPKPNIKPIRKLE